MSLAGNSFLSISDLEDKDIQEIFRRADIFKKLSDNHESFNKAVDFSDKKSHLAFCVFTEASTRTRMSFEMACSRLGIHPCSFGVLSQTSLSKGETVVSTLETLFALKPSIVILRQRQKSLPFDSPIPVVNAGFGSFEHPTQALIDAWTIKQARGQIKSEKVLIIGDVLHSRVSNSNLKLLRRLGAEVAVSSPASLQPQGDFWQDVRRFENLNEGIKWASCVMCLRIQKERHDTGLGLSIAEYRDYYHFGPEELSIFNKKGAILHPGPYIYGIEISKEIFKDPRCWILKQVENGPHIRAAVLSLMLDFKMLV